MLISAETKLGKLRDLMKCSRLLPKDVPALAAYIIPSEDAHYSEYTAPQHKRRQFISGFTGSAGTAVVTTDKALLWTDGRYFTQALAELDEKFWTLMKAHVEGTPELQTWLADHCATGSFIGADPMLISQQNWEKWHKALEKCGSKLVSVNTNLIDEIWKDFGQTQVAVKMVFKHPLEYSGETWSSKVQRVREKMAEQKCELLVLAELDEICWLFNLRGSDIEYNPVFFAFSIVTSNEVLLFINSDKLDCATMEHLDGAQIRPYTDIIPTLKLLAIDCIKSGSFVWMATQTNHALADEVLKIDERKLILKNTPVKLFKAVKNEVEIQGMRDAHVRDGLALCEYLCYLDKTVGGEGANVEKATTELSGAEMLDGLRSQQEKFVSLSFSTITGSGPNAAVIHYSASPETNRVLTKDELYLVDSGGQYLDGTTDVTRTVSFTQTPHLSQVHAYTLVLKGHIALAELVIPSGTLGHRIDCVARQFLWKSGLNYLHGTGHGIGSFLNVHEGPQSISYRTNPNEEGLKAGMIVSNEPGYYKTGSFGIRIESVMVYKEIEQRNDNDSKTLFLKPETITCVPLDRKLIDKTLLTAEEIAWINDYHEFCWTKLSPLAEKLGKTEVINWLKCQTTKL